MKNWGDLKTVIRCTRWVWLVLGWVLVWGATASGQENTPDFESVYSLGVHQYFSEEYQAAYETLAHAKLIDPNDPRPYYFRGLAAYQLGFDGRLDFEVGARTEARVAGAAALVSRSLERVQGPLRLYLEELRISARIEFEKSSARRTRILR
ncbi:MAG TPA: hypothetical protein PKD54_00190 [Pirellulaceae bacterium]|nr:hypothetical protein [Pirellulaceae bacterium]